MTNVHHLIHRVRLAEIFVVIHRRKNFLLDVARHFFIALVGFVMSPLKHSAIRAANSDQKFVIVAKAAFCCVQTMPDVTFIIGSPHITWVSEQSNDAVFVGGCDDALVATSSATIDICSVAVLGPYPLHRPTGHTRPRCPLGVFQRRSEFNHLARRHFPEEELKVLRVGLQVFAIRAPVNVGDRCAMTFADASALEFALHIVDVNEKIIASHREPTTVRAKLDIADDGPSVLLGDYLRSRLFVVRHETTSIKSNGNDFAIWTIGAAPCATRHVTNT